MSRELSCDVAIVGGGPAGCTTALGLARLGVSHILVVDAARNNGRRVGESIPPDARILLRRLGILDKFLAEEHEPCLGSCSSWGDDALGYNDFLLNPQGSGWHLDRRRFDTLLMDEVVSSGVKVCSGDRLVGCESSDTRERRLRFVTAGGAMKTVRARFAVDATGAEAVLARRVGARRVFIDRLICVYGFFTLPEGVPFSRLTLLEAVDIGWWYAARLPNGEVAVALASDPDTIRKSAATEAESWRALLSETRHVACALAKCAFIKGSLRVCPAPSFCLDRTAGSSWLAVGDAASAYDPICAQGIYKALYDGLLAAETMVANLGGSATAIEAYHASVTKRFEQYLANRNYFYSIERRFAASPFWRRRQEALQPALSSDD